MLCSGTEASRPADSSVPLSTSSAVSHRPQALCVARSATFQTLEVDFGGKTVTFLEPSCIDDSQICLSLPACSPSTQSHVVHQDISLWLSCCPLQPTWGVWRRCSSGTPSPWHSLAVAGRDLTRQFLVPGGSAFFSLWPFPSHSLPQETGAGCEPGGFCSPGCIWHSLENSHFGPRGEMAPLSFLFSFSLLVGTAVCPLRAELRQSYRRSCGSWRAVRCPPAGGAWEGRGAWAPTDSLGGEPRLAFACFALSGRRAIGVSLLCVQVFPARDYRGPSPKICVRESFLWGSCIPFGWVPAASWCQWSSA